LGPTSTSHLKKHTRFWLRFNLPHLNFHRFRNCHVNLSISFHCRYITKIKESGSLGKNLAVILSIRTNKEVYRSRGLLKEKLHAPFFMEIIISALWGISINMNNKIFKNKVSGWNLHEFPLVGQRIKHKYAQ
jgi:hypothetical protein